jgi:hypothetical protein
MRQGEGWILFAWIMLLVAGVMAVIDGIVALSNASFFEDVGAHYVGSNLTTWGWVALIMGIVTILAAGSVWQGTQWGRWFGIIIAGIGVIVQLSWIPIVPFWALFIMFLYILVIYGLAVYGGEEYRSSP